MHEKDEFSFCIGEPIPTQVREKLHQTLGQYFSPTENGEWGRDYYCPLGRLEGLRVLEELKQSLLRESGDELRFDIENPLARPQRFTLTNVIIELK
jgi:hypothetical protein